MPTLRQLEYLIALSEENNFSRAAKRCNVSQPTLSIQITSLEEKLGRKILERQKRGIIFTDIGQRILQEAYVITEHHKNIYMISQQHANPLAGDLTLGVIPTVAPYYLPKIIPHIKKEFPQLRLFLKEAQTEQLLKELQQGTIQAALIALPSHDHLLSEFPIVKEEFYVAYPKGKASKQTVSIESLKDEHILLLEEGHCLRQQSLEICEFPQEITHADFKATSLETLKHMVASGLGITLLPERAIDENREYDIQTFKGTPPSRTIGLVWRRSSVQEDAFKQLATTMESALINV